MEIRNRGKRRCQFKDGDSILHNDRISGDNNPRPGGDVKVQINTYQPAVLSEGQVLQPCDSALHPGGHLPGGWSEPVCLLPE